MKGLTNFSIRMAEVFATIVALNCVGCVKEPPGPSEPIGWVVKAQGTWKSKGKLIKGGDPVYRGMEEPKADPNDKDPILRVCLRDGALKTVTRDHPLFSKDGAVGEIGTQFPLLTALFQHYHGDL